MLYSVLAGLICTTSNVNPGIFVRNVLNLAVYFIKYYKLVNKRLHDAMPAKRLSAGKKVSTRQLSSGVTT